MTDQIRLIYSQLSAAARLSDAEYAAALRYYGVRRGPWWRRMLYRLWYG